MFSSLPSLSSSVILTPSILSSSLEKTICYWSTNWTCPAYFKRPGIDPRKKKTQEKTDLLKKFCRHYWTNKILTVRYFEVAK